MLTKGKNHHRHRIALKTKTHKSGCVRRANRGKEEKKMKEKCVHTSICRKFSINNIELNVAAAQTHARTIGSVRWDGGHVTA